MSRFAQYYIRFKHDAGCYDWEKRQQHLGATSGSRVRFKNEATGSYIDNYDSYTDKRRQYMTDMLNYILSLGFSI